MPLDLHSLFTLMSMTKLLTVVAALQQVDLGRITLDEDVSPLVPLLAAQPVLAGFDDAGAPRLEPRNRPITLRHLLTHSAGTAYDFLQPALQQYRKAIGKPPAVPDMTGSMEERLAYPLLFQPGEGWVYGTGNDWAGRIVEKLSGLTLEEYFKTQLLPAIGGGVVTFFPTREPAVEARLWSSLPVRDAETGKMVHGPAPPAAASECYGGSGGYADVTVYINLLGSLLADDGRLLRPETAALLFQPQLGPAAKKMLLVETEARNSGWIVGSIPDTGEYDWSLAGLLVDGDSHPLRKRGAALWGGMFNLAWVSPTDGISKSLHVPTADLRLVARSSIGLPAWQPSLPPTCCRPVMPR